MASKPPTVAAPASAEAKRAQLKTLHALGAARTPEQTAQLLDLLAQHVLDAGK